MALSSKAGGAGLCRSKGRRRCRTTSGMSSPKFMRNIHTERASPGRIPVLSPTVHCVAMTALVYLRTSFGYAVLRPKSIFFAFSWAFCLFAYIAWNEPALWSDYRAVWIFGFGAVALYWLHFLIAISRELYRVGEHDHYSGESHLLRLRRGKPMGGSLA